MQGGRKRLCLPQINKGGKKSKSFHKSSFFRVNGFLPFTGDALPPLVSANIRGSEDGAENIPPAPPFRPINCISPKQRGNFSSLYFLLFLFTVDRLFLTDLKLCKGERPVCFFPFILDNKCALETRWAR